jgi:uncharacterized membrane protein required for colicin V production
MQEFFTWAMLGTYAGAVLATTLITQLVKEWLKAIPTRIVSYVIALGVLLAAAAFNNALTLADGALCLFNAVIVSLAANGGFDAVTKE